MRYLPKRREIPVVFVRLDERKDKVSESLDCEKFLRRRRYDFVRIF